jgi:hypothetical protein
VVKKLVVKISLPEMLQFCKSLYLSSPIAPGADIAMIIVLEVT